jgi:hypothetical protein
MRRAALATVAVLTLAACGPGDVHNGDDDGGTADANGMSGLVFRFVAPDLGQTVDDLTVSQIHLSVRDVRALGDAAPGDDRTTLDRDQIDLPGTEEVRFDQAPPGRYSSFELEIDRAQDGESSWSMTGSVHFNGDDWGFAIDDEESRPISLPLVDVNLRAGEIATFTVQIDVSGICSGVDWESLPQEDPLEIDHESPQIAGIRTNLTAAFSIVSVDVQ